jgi:hypothetical protein
MKLRTWLISLLFGIATAVSGQKPGLHETVKLKTVTTTFILRDTSGKILDKRVLKNTITNVGHACANGLMSNQGSYGYAVYLAIGIGTETGSTATALNSEITTGGGARHIGTASQTTTTVTNDTTSLTYTWTFTSSFAITEEGILTASSSGTLFAYQTFSAINVVNTNTLQVTHTYQT